MNLIKKINPYLLIVFCFFITGLIGGILLYCPFSQLENVNVSFIDSLFTSISALCVTGLSTLDIGNTFNYFGISVIALLIQLGGLGVICSIISIILLLGQKIGIKQRILVKESVNATSVSGIIRLVLTILKITFTIEIIGIIIFFFVFISDYSIKESIIISIFHSISSFNNAGFDILGNFNSLMPYTNNFLLNITTSLLIILGGLGFLVINDIISVKKFKKLRLHSKIVITTSISLIIIGMILLKFSEDITWLQSFFMSVSARTAGFNTVAISNFSNFSILILIVLMFIGASPSSTGGGIKTTTFYTLIKGTISICQNKDLVSNKRKISDNLITRSFVILFMALVIIFASTTLLCIFEPTKSFISLLFEVVSALGTVGLSLDVTTSLSIYSKIIIIIVMFIGRVGTITLMSVWMKKNKKTISYPEEELVVG